VSPILKIPTVIGLVALTPLTAHAHAFIQPYKLPMPYWLYIYGAVVALALSFLLVGYFVTRAPDHSTQNVRYFGHAPWLHQLRQWHLKTLLQTLSVTLLGLCIVTGLFGSSDPYRNFNMTFFWLICAVGLPYLTVFIGNFYAILNPWQVLAHWLSRLLPTFSQGILAYPKHLAYWPALLLYIGFIWLELFGNTRPFSLSIVLLSYTVLNLVGVGLIGRKAWFKYVEFFSVLFWLLAKMAPVAYRPNQSGAARWAFRPPFSGLLSGEPTHISLLLFVLFILSSTAFDGLRDTVIWFSLFWKDATGLLTPLIGEAPIYAYGWLRPWYFLYETVWLILSPLLYFGLFWVFLALGKRLTRSPLPMQTLIQQFAYSLLPIALVYHATHYYTLLLSQGVKIRALVSDPFGWNWDLFGTAYTLRIPILPDMGLIWYSQVALILCGHVLSVYLAHRQALRIFPTHRQAVLSQLPILVLMVLFTTVGLWILAQPLQGR